MGAFFGRLIAYVFVGSFCLAGPVLLAVALAVAGSRVMLLSSGLHAAGTVVAMRPSQATHPSFAPVFEFTAQDGESHTVISDVGGSEHRYAYGQRVDVLYPAGNPSAARIDAFASLWMLPLVAGTVGAGFSIIPAMVVTGWIRRRRQPGTPLQSTAGGNADASAPLWVRRTLGVLLLGAGLALVASATGLLPASAGSAQGSAAMSTFLGIVLGASGLLLGQWTAADSRLTHALGGATITSMAALFGWVSLYGDASGFSAGIGAGGARVATSGHVTAARIAFGVGAVCFGLMSLLAWKAVFRRRS